MSRKKRGETGRYCRISEMEQLLRGSEYRRNLTDVDSTPGHHITTYVTMDVFLNHVDPFHL